MIFFLFILVPIKKQLISTRLTINNFRLKNQAPGFFLLELVVAIGVFMGLMTMSLALAHGLLAQHTGIKKRLTRITEQANNYESRPRAGFTLIELLVYCALFSGLSYLAFAYIGNLRVPIQHSAQLVTNNSNEAVLQELVYRDLLSMTPDSMPVLVQCGVLEKQTLDDTGLPVRVWVGYTVADGFLCRRQGVFDPKKLAWGASQRAYLPTTMLGLTFQPVQAPGVGGVVVPAGSAGTGGLVQATGLGSAAWPGPGSDRVLRAVFSYPSGVEVERRVRLRNTVPA